MSQVTDEIEAISSKVQTVQQVHLYGCDRLNEMREALRDLEDRLDAVEKKYRACRTAHLG